MHPVEAPQQRDLMRRAVSRIPADRGDGESRHDLHPGWARRDTETQRCGHERAQHAADHNNRDDQSDFQRGTVDQKVHQVGAPTHTQNSAGVQREKALERNEDHREDRQTEQDIAAHTKCRQDHQGGQRRQHRAAEPDLCARSVRRDVRARRRRLGGDEPNWQNGSRSAAPNLPAPSTPQGSQIHRPPGSGWQTRSQP